MSRITPKNNNVNLTQRSNNVMIQPQVDKVITVIKNNNVIIRAPGIAGPKGNAGTSVLVNSGLPTSDVGKVGDLYLDSSSRRLYGPKDIAGWHTDIYTGLSGYSFYTGIGSASDSFGNNGDTYLDTLSSTIYTKIDNTWSDPRKLLSVELFSQTHEQQSASSQWNIVHNLGFKPAVSVMDYAKTNIECDIEHVDENELILRFIQAGVPIQVSGYAYLS